MPEMHPLIQINLYDQDVSGGVEWSITSYRKVKESQTAWNISSFLAARKSQKSPIMKPDERYLAHCEPVLDWKRGKIRTFN